MHITITGLAKRAPNSKKGGATLHVDEDSHDGPDDDGSEAGPAQTRPKSKRLSRNPVEQPTKRKGCKLLLYLVTLKGTAASDTGSELGKNKNRSRTRVTSKKKKVVVEKILPLECKKT